MNEIFERRSIRRFTSREVSEEQLERLLRAAMQAPSARNQQPWEFVVIRDKETFDGIMKFQPYTRPLRTASAAVAVCGNTNRLGRAAPFWVQDCSAAMQNLLLEAAHLGLGAVWMGIYPREKWVEALSSLLKLPEGVIPLGVAAIGYPEEGQKNEFADRFRPEYIHRGKW